MFFPLDFIAQENLSVVFLVLWGFLWLILFVSSFNFELVAIIISTILLLYMFLFFLSSLASIHALCHMSAAIFSDRELPSCVVQNWGFDHREINPLAMGYRVLSVCASLSGKLIKVMCKTPAIWVEDTYTFLKLSQCFFSFLIPNSFVL